jgi:hypothetical protein
MMNIQVLLNPKMRGKRDVIEVLFPRCPLDPKRGKYNCAALLTADPERWGNTVRPQSRCAAFPVDPGQGNMDA